MYAQGNGTSNNSLNITTKEKKVHEEFCSLYVFIVVIRVGWSAIGLAIPGVYLQSCTLYRASG